MGRMHLVKQGSTIKGFYGHDALGRRSLKTVGSLMTISIFDGWQCVYQRVTGSGTDTTKAFTFGNYVDEPVTMIRKWGSSTDTAWYLQGGNYNVEALTDRTGTVEERYGYTPYGKPTIYTGVGTDGKWFTSDDVSSTVSAKGNNILFQGRELDAESGNSQFRARFYSSNLGRFVNRDPIRFTFFGKSLFYFDNGSPMGRKDPSGLSSGDGMWEGDVKMTPRWASNGVPNLTDEGCCTGEDGKRGILQNVNYSGSWWLNDIVMQEPDYSGMDQSEKDDPGDLMKSLIEHEKSHIRITNKWLAILKGKKQPLNKSFTICNTGNLQNALDQGLAPIVLPLMNDLLLPWMRENNRLDKAFGTAPSFPGAGT